MPNSIDTFPAEGRPADASLVREIAELIRSALNLEMTADQIDPSAPLYKEGLGLDSIDILEVALVISKRYGFKLKDDDQDNVDFTASPAPALIAVSVSATTIHGKKSVKATVLFNQKLTDTAVVRLSSSNSAIASVPATVTVARKKNSATFTIQVKPAKTTTFVVITASFAGSVHDAVLTVSPR
jgi:acyl carrier protein